MALVEIDTVARQHRTILLLECHSSMVFLLSIDVIDNLLLHGFAHGKSAIARLPSKVFRRVVRLVDLFRRIRLDQAHCFGN